MRRTRPNRERPPLDRGGLEALATHYAGRYLTTRERLAAYLRRKLGERGGPPDAERIVAEVVARAADLGFVDDRAFATARAADHARRGLGTRRLRATLHHAGVTDEDSAPVLSDAEEGGWQAALAFARRRRLGPFGPAPDDPAARRRGFAALVRAGHPPALAGRVLSIDPEELED